MAADSELDQNWRLRLFPIIAHAPAAAAEKQRFSGLEPFSLGSAWGH
jgi:hypothetical protein